ncbi:uncharacterized protein LOC135427773 isoform X2 [Drosophila montana]|uniref:uncharacterized protein LOC135427773 isoform X2 n=1 Tax=Drosophila montana TaxID=40370 RepID=UPI00313B1117
MVKLKNALKIVLLAMGVFELIFAEKVSTTIASAALQRRFEDVVIVSPELVMDALRLMSCDNTTR